MYLDKTFGSVTVSKDGDVVGTRKNLNVTGDAVVTEDAATETINLHIEGGGGSSIALASHATFRALDVEDLQDGEVITFQSPPGTFVYSTSLGAGQADDDVTVLKLTDVSPGANGRAYNVNASPVLPTFAALRLAVSGQQPSISLQAYAVARDGGGGIFDYDSSDTTTADDGGTVAVAGTRRYRRRGSSAQAFDARHFGVRADLQLLTAVTLTSGSPTCTIAGLTTADIGKAIGFNTGALLSSMFVTTISNVSGTTITLAANAPSTGTYDGFYATDDATALAAWLAAVNASSRKTGRLPAGAVYTTGTFTPAADVLIFGDRHRTRLYPNVSDYFFHLSSSGIHLKDFQIRGLAGPSCDRPVLIDTTSDIELDHLRIEDVVGRTGNYADIYAFGATSDITLRDVRLEGNGFAATPSTLGSANADLFLHYSYNHTGWRIEGLVCNRTKATRTQWQLATYNLSDHDFRGIWIRGQGINGPDVQGYGWANYNNHLPAFSATGGKATGIHIENTPGSGLYLQGVVQGAYSVIDLVDTALLQDDTTLPAGALSVNNDPADTNASKTGGALTFSGVTVTRVGRRTSGIKIQGHGVTVHGFALDGGKEKLGTTTRPGIDLVGHCERVKIGPGDIKNFNGGVRKAATVSAFGVVVHDVTFRNEYSRYTSVTFDGTADTITISGGHSLLEGQAIQFIQNGALPTYLAPSPCVFYVKNTTYTGGATADGTTIQVSLAPGGSVLNFVGNGSGSNYVQVAQPTGCDLYVATFNASTDVVTATGHPFYDGERIIAPIVPSGSSAPTFSPNSFPAYLYSVVKGVSFKLSSTAPGAAPGYSTATPIDITGAGSGILYVQGVQAPVNSGFDIEACDGAQLSNLRTDNSPGQGFYIGTSNHVKAKALHARDSGIGIGAAEGVRIVDSKYGDYAGITSEAISTSQSFGIRETGTCDGNTFRGCKCVDNNAQYGLIGANSFLDQTCIRIDSGVITQVSNPSRTGAVLNVRGASVSNLGAHTGSLTHDGVTYATGDLILDKDNSTDNTSRGVWRINTSGAWTRADEFNSVFAAMPNTLIRAREGTTNGGKDFRLLNTGTVTPGTTVMSFGCRELVETVTYGATTTFDFAISNHKAVTLTGNVTFAFSNLRDGETLTLYITQDGTGSRTATWPGTAKFVGSDGTLTTTASKTDLYTGKVQGGNVYFTASKGY